MLVFGDALRGLVGWGRPPRGPVWGGGRPPRGPVGGDRLGWGRIRQTIQSPDILYKAPGILDKAPETPDTAPTDYTKPPKDYRNL